MEGQKIKLGAFINTALKKLVERDLPHGLIKRLIKVIEQLNVI